jgi:hypothetical protein
MFLGGPRVSCHRYSTTQSRIEEYQSSAYPYWPCLQFPQRVLRHVVGLCLYRESLILHWTPDGKFYVGLAKDTSNGPCGLNVNV